LCWSLCFCAGPEAQIDKDSLFDEVVTAVPEYQDFLTVDELHQSLKDLKEKYRSLISLELLAETDSGNPIYEFRIGEGKNHALLFGFPHPNEPIGSMMLHHLTRELAENEGLRRYFDFTWHIVICAEPDKAKLNEGWFKGDLTLTKYARNFYRPPLYQQVDWTFPVSYKEYTFDSPTAEARALMKIIDAYPINFSFSLHNSGFGGAYYYWSDDVSELYPVLYAFIAEQGIPLHLGEPEVPFGVKFDDKAMFKMFTFNEIYDYTEKHSPVPPKDIFNSGTSSEEYISGKYKSLAVVCELPYFYDPRIDDTSPSDMTRRQANLEGIENRREILSFLKSHYEKAQPLLTAHSLFVDAIEEYLDKGETNIATMESAVQTGEDYARQATVAEKWDALTVSKFYSLLTVGQFVRLLEHEKAVRGEEFPETLQSVMDESLEFFEAKSAEVEAELDYTVVPIKKLASVQLVTALHTMDYVQNHPELGAQP
jgi:hypothetical protein